MVSLRDGEGLQGILSAVGVPAKACNLVPQVVQVCQRCRPWKRPGQSNKLTFSLALAFDEGVQFDLMPYRSQLEFALGGARGIFIAHFVGCCIGWSACVLSLSKSTNDLLDCISNAWVHVFGKMGTFTLHTERDRKGKDIDDWAMCNQMTMKYKSPRKNALLVERHDALIRGGLQRAEAQVIKESLCVSFNRAFGLVAFMHNARVSINNQTPYQALLGRQQHFLPPLEGGYYGDLGVKGQNDFAGVRRTTAVAIIEAIAK